MRTLKFKGQPTNAFFATVNQMFDGSSELPTTVERAVIKSRRWAQVSQHSRNMEGAAEHLIDSSEKRNCRLTFEFKSPHVIERRSKRALWPSDSIVIEKFTEVIPCPVALVSGWVTLKIFYFVTEA